MNQNIYSGHHLKIYLKYHGVLDLIGISILYLSNFSKRESIESKIGVLPFFI